MKAHTKKTQATMTPEKSLQFLKEGNIRFQNNLRTNRNLLEQVNDTSDAHSLRHYTELHRLSQFGRVGF